jgi:hypothetical protein
MDLLTQIKEKGERLSELRKQIGAVEVETEAKLAPAILKIEQFKQQQETILKPLKTERDIVQDELLNLMADAELSSVKTKSGDSFMRMIKKGWKVTNEALALRYAYDKNMTRVELNKAEINKHLDSLVEIPEGFEKQETVYMQVKLAKQEN